jgi:hypothetical protein
MTRTMTQIPSSKDITKARETVAACVHQLERRVRKGTTTDLAALAQAYTESAKLTKRLENILG